MYRFSLASIGILSFILSGCSSMGGVTPDASVGDMPSSGPVGKTMKSNREKFVACGRDSVTIQTGTTQRIQLRFSISPEGQVQKAKVAQMTAADPDLHQCVLRALHRIKFPPPNDGSSKELTYPLILRPE